MRKVMQIGAAAAVLLLVGCASIHGTWSKVSFEPKSAEGDFEFGRVTLMENGEYSAKVAYEDDVREYKGSYDYDKEADEITFKAKQGMKRTYDVDLNWMGNKMTISGVTDDGSKWEAVMKKQ